MQEVNSRRDAGAGAEQSQPQSRPAPTLGAGKSRLRPEST
jgi:hypothetical protein